MRKQICLMLTIVPLVASAQKDIFTDEFNRVNNWFFAQPKSVLIQKYFYYNDSAMQQAVDSSNIIISKNNTAIDYKANGLESFSDSGYIVKINHAGKYIIVYRTAKTDTGQLRAIFNQGFAAFATFTRTTARGISIWHLSGGTEGVDSATMELDAKLQRIKTLEMFLAGNHPLVTPFKKAGQTAAATVIIKVQYLYPALDDGYNTGMLSDFINVTQPGITPSLKYKDYRIKLATEKQ